MDFNNNKLHGVTIKWSSPSQPKFTVQHQTVAAAFFSTAQEMFKAKISGVTLLGWSSTIWDFLSYFGTGQWMFPFTALAFFPQYCSRLGCTGKQVAGQTDSVYYLTWMAWYLNKFRTWAPKYIVFLTDFGCYIICPILKDHTDRGSSVEMGKHCFHSRITSGRT